MKKDDRIYLDHILKSFSKVVEYLEDADYEAFLKNEKKQDSSSGCVRCYFQETQRGINAKSLIIIHLPNSRPIG